MFSGFDGFITLYEDDWVGGSSFSGPQPLFADQENISFNKDISQRLQTAFSGRVHHGSSLVYKETKPKGGIEYQFRSSDILKVLYAHFQLGTIQSGTSPYRYAFYPRKNALDWEYRGTYANEAYGSVVGQPYSISVLRKLFPTEDNAGTNSFLFKHGICSKLAFKLDAGDNARAIPEFVFRDYDKGTAVPNQVSFDCPIGDTYLYQPTFSAHNFATTHAFNFGTTLTSTVSTVPDIFAIQTGLEKAGFQWTCSFTFTPADYYAISDNYPVTSGLGIYYDPTNSDTGTSPVFLPADAFGMWNGKKFGDPAGIFRAHFGLVSGGAGAVYTTGTFPFEICTGTVSLVAGTENANGKRNLIASGTINNGGSVFAAGTTYTDFFGTHSTGKVKLYMFGPYEISGTNYTIYHESILVGSNMGTGCPNDSVIGDYGTTPHFSYWTATALLNGTAFDISSFELNSDNSARERSHVGRFDPEHYQLGAYSVSGQLGFDLSSDALQHIGSMFSGSSFSVVATLFNGTNDRVIFELPFCKRMPFDFNNARGDESWKARMPFQAFENAGTYPIKITVDSEYAFNPLSLFGDGWLGTRTLSEFGLYDATLGARTLTDYTFYSRD